MLKKLLAILSLFAAVFIATPSSSSAVTYVGGACIFNGYGFESTWACIYAPDFNTTYGINNFQDLANGMNNTVSSVYVGGYSATITSNVACKITMYRDTGLGGPTFTLDYNFGGPQRTGPDGKIYYNTRAVHDLGNVTFSNGVVVDNRSSSATIRCTR